MLIYSRHRWPTVPNSAQTTFSEAADHRRAVHRRRRLQGQGLPIWDWDQVRQWRNVWKFQTSIVRSLPRPAVEQVPPAWLCPDPAGLWQDGNDTHVGRRPIDLAIWRREAWLVQQGVLRGASRRSSRENTTGYFTVYASAFRVSSSDFRVCMKSCGPGGDDRKQSRFTPS